MSSVLVRVVLIRQAVVSVGRLEQRSVCLRCPLDLIPRIAVAHGRVKCVQTQLSELADVCSLQPALIVQLMTELHVMAPCATASEQARIGDVI